MASLHKVKQHGRNVYRVSFYDKDGERRFIRLGEMEKKFAESIAQHVQQLANYSIAGEAPDAVQTAWLGKIGQDLADKLASVGLIAKREPVVVVAAIGLAEFIDGYLKGRTDTKAGTKTNYGQARRHLIEYFGAERAIDSITAGDADEYRRHLLAEWRLIFALARFGGLRTPSELLTLRWADVNLPAGRMTVHRPKTEGHAGKAMRVVPIFAELRPYLEDCEALTEPGTEFVINRYRQANINLRTPLERIIGRAGLTPWPKLF